MDIDPIFHHDDDDVTFITNLFNRSHSSHNNPSLHLSLAPPHSHPIPNDLDLELGLGFPPHASDSTTTTTTSASHSHSQLLELGLGFGFSDYADPPPFQGLRVVGFDSDSDSDSGGVTDFDRPPFCWDYLGFNDNNHIIHHSRCLGFDGHYHGVESHPHTHTSSDHGVIDDSGLFTHIHHHHYHYHHHDGAPTIRWDMDNGAEREVRQMSSLFGTYPQRATEHEVMIPSHTDDPADFDVDDAIRDLEWEILLAVNNFNREVYEMDFNADMYDAVLTEVDEHNGDGLPAADSVIRNLSVVRLSGESLKENYVACAICKDDFVGEEELSQLPCSHYYHGNCIVPWLRIRNTCPVCRYELPTEDPNCEDVKREREGSSTTTNEGDVSANSQIGFDFHVFL